MTGSDTQNEVKVMQGEGKMTGNEKEKALKASVRSTAGTILLKSIRMRTAGITLSFIPVQGRVLSVRVIIRISPQKYTLNYRKTWRISKADW